MHVGTKNSSIYQAIQKIAVGPDRGRDLSRADSRDVMRAILDGKVDEVQTAVFLIALRMKRESMDEFLGLFDALQEHQQSVISDCAEVVCLAEPFDGYVRTATVTPFIPAVLAANGIHSVMHGVRSVGPKHGVTAHKVYAAAGINVAMSLKEASGKLSSVGWSYVDQSNYAPALFALAGLRDRIVKRTALTTLERLAAPIKGRQATHLVLGYVHNAYPSIYATVAKQAGFDSKLLLKGVEGGLAPAANKPLRRFLFDRDLPDNIDQQKELIDSDALFSAASAAPPRLSDENPVQECLELGLKTLSGAQGIARDSLSLAAGQILFALGQATSLAKAVDNVQLCLDNGLAQARFRTMMETAR
ncbi:MAG: anthranilate phosphoribosyltransferase [Cryomorphaceae bacterium]|jgi:anthranilate phosphoribosyltransferase